MKISLLLLLLFVFNASALEYIRDFHSRIDVLDNGDILVTETIKVNVENSKIRHGIFRSTPTVYFGVFFTHKNTDITLTNALLDGKNVDYHQENLINGIRVYLGSKDYLVSRGLHTYQIEYIAQGQVKTLGENNGIYWNVTGTDWEFPILKASADVYMPNLADFKIVSEEAWTGTRNDTDQNYDSKKYSNYIHFETNKKLAARQGLTIQAIWPKGFITDPNNTTWLFIKNNFLWILSVILLLLYPLYFYRTWKKVGIDPPKGAVFPQFKPPNNISPAAMRFIKNSYYDTKSFSIAIMNLAVKKYISIEQKTKKEYKLTKINGKDLPSLSSGEARIHDYIFKNNRSITVGKTYNSRIKTANDLLEGKIVDEHKDACYKDNLMAWILGILISMLMVFINWVHFFNFSSYAVQYLIMSMAVIMLSAFGLIALKKNYQKVTIISISVIVFIILLKFQTEKIYFAFVALILMMVVVNAIFYHLIKAPTVFGRKLLDDIEGFQMYLETAEQDRLELMHPPEMTPQLFEKYLPYALALGVENSWSKQFNNAMKIQNKDYQNYHPSWYIGTDYSHTNFASTATALGAGLASSVVSASTPPSSNSGGGFGGGFSGGGGGGGGGGGW